MDSCYPAYPQPGRTTNQPTWDSQCGMIQCTAALPVGKYILKNQRNVCCRIREIHGMTNAMYPRNSIEPHCSELCCNRRLLLRWDNRYADPTSAHTPVHETQAPQFKAQHSRGENSAMLCITFTIHCLSVLKTFQGSERY